MRLNRLSLTNFRNFTRLSIDFPRSVTVLQGDNAQGKTNLLEAIYYLATSRSPRASVEREVVNWLTFDEPLVFARLDGEISRDATGLRIEITLVKQGDEPPDASRFSKQIRINGVNRRALDLLGSLPVVLFLPEDTHLVSGSPSRRRRYLRAMMCQIDAAHCRMLSRFDRVLAQRNALLKNLREGGARRAEQQLRFWDEQLVDLGSRLTVRRAEIIAALDEEVRLQYRHLSAGRDRVRLVYQSGVLHRLSSYAHRTAGGSPQGRDARANATDLQQLAPLYEERLARLLKRELAVGSTLLGPHRDDLAFLDDGHDLRAYGSRGQQRTAALALKLAEVGVMTAQLGEPPLLLLDDVMSELDARRRAALLELLSIAPQSIVTTTDWGSFSASFLDRAHCLLVVEGRVEEAKAVPLPDEEHPLGPAVDPIDLGS